MVESERNGKKVTIPEKVGLKAITREGFDYEMTVAFDLSINHYATCTKDRTKGDDGLALFQDRPARILNEETGKTLKKWSESGSVDVNELKREVVRQLTRLKLAPPIDPEAARAWVLEAVKKLTGIDVADDKLEEIVNLLRAHMDLEKTAALMFPQGRNQTMQITPQPAITKANEILAEVSIMPNAAPEAPVAPTVAPTIEKPPVIPPAERDVFKEAMEAKTDDEGQAVIDYMIGDLQSPQKVCAIAAIVRAKKLTVYLPGEKNDLQGNMAFGGPGGGPGGI